MSDETSGTSGAEKPATKKTKAKPRKQPASRGAKRSVKKHAPRLRREDLKISGYETAKADDLVPYKAKSQIYVDIVNKIAGFTKAGQRFRVKPPKGVTLANFRTRLGSATKDAQSKMKPGLSFSRRATVNDEIAFICIDAKGRKAKK